MANKPFQFGAYPNGPDFPTHAQQFADITRLMGAAPLWQVLYVHEQQPISGWISNAEWGSGVWAGSASAGCIPNIGFPLFSVAGGQPSRDDQMSAFAAGSYDDVVRGCLRAYARYAKVQEWRIGWEMNLQGTAWFVGDNPTSWGLWIEAFRRVAAVLRDEAQQQGVTIVIAWCPGAISWSNAGRADQTLWPGPEHVDVVGIDLYNQLWPNGGDYPYDWTTGQPTWKYDWILNPANRRHHWLYSGADQWSPHGDSPGNQSFSLAMAIDLARNTGKPLSLGETGVFNVAPPIGVPDDAEFPAFLADALGQAGVPIHSVCIWDAGDYHPEDYAYWSPPGTLMPHVQAAWVANFGVEGIEAPEPPEPEPEPPGRPETLTVRGTFTATIELPARRRRGTIGRR